MHPRLAVLLPPSEGKSEGGTLPGWDPADGVFGPRLAYQRRRIAKALRTVKGGDDKLVGIGGEAGERARLANRSLVGAPTRPAGERFTGVVWDHLGLDTLDDDTRRRASDAIVVVSAVAGLVGIDDPLPDHRLKLSVTLPPLGRVAAFWRRPLSAALDEHLQGRLVIDLLPGEHVAAWAPDPRGYDLRRVTLRHRDGRNGGHLAKAAKGALARALVSADDPLTVLDGWDDPLFTLDITRTGDADPDPDADPDAGTSRAAPPGTTTPGPGR